MREFIMPDFPFGIAQITDLKPKELDSFAAGSDVPLEAKGSGTLFKSPTTTVSFRIISSVSSVSMESGATGSFASAVNFVSSSATVDTPFPVSVNGMHSRAAKGWYRLVAVVNAQQQITPGVFGEPITLDSRSTIYKVGDPDTNIPYSEVKSLWPCSDTLAKGSLIDARSKVAVSVKDDPAKQRYKFTLYLNVIRPNGTVAARFTGVVENVKGGAIPKERIVHGAVLLDRSGIWQTQIVVQALDLDTPLSKEVVINNQFCQFSVAEGSASSSSSSSSSSSAA